MEREKYAGQPFKEAGKVLVSVTCFSLFNEQPGWSRHRFFSIPHKYFLITLYERYSFYKCYSSARTMASNLKGVPVKLWWHLLTWKHWKEQRLETWQSSGLAFYLKTGMQGRPPPLNCIVFCFQEWSQSFWVGSFSSGSKFKTVFPASSCVSQRLMNAGSTEPGCGLSKAEALKQMDTMWTCGSPHQLLHPLFLPRYLLL